MAPGLPSALEAGLPPAKVRVERRSVLYILQAKDLLNTYPVAKAIRSTILLKTTRSLPDGVEIRMPKIHTQIQGIKLRQTLYLELPKGKATKLLKKCTSKAWKLEFLSQKEKQKQRAGNCFSKYV